MTTDHNPDIRVSSTDTGIMDLLAEDGTVAAYHFKLDTIFITRKMLNCYDAPEGFLGVLNHEIMHRVLFKLVDKPTSYEYDWLPIWFDEEVQRGSF